VSVVCQVEVYALGWSLVQRSAAECDLSLSVITKPDKAGHDPESGRSSIEGGE
jgi:hypothetical protein